MGLYIGTEVNSVVDLIASLGISKSKVKEIVDSLNIYNIGELKFLTGFSSDDMEGLSFDSSTNSYYISDYDKFKGWIFPNGMKLKASDFPKASSIYNKSHATTFSVPNLTDYFLRGSTTNSDLEIIGHLNTIPCSHSHGISDSAGSDNLITIKDGFVFCVTSDTSSSANYATYWTTGADPKRYKVIKCHKASFNKKDINGVDFPFKIDIKLKLSDIQAMFASGQTKGVNLDGIQSNPEFWPANQLMPVMMYVGKRDKLPTE